MESRLPEEAEETPTAPRDPPLWVRGVAAVLLLFASWWLLNTDSIRSVVGDSIGVLSLGVIAASILQGMHLPLGLWPDGPWRRRFELPAVIATALAIALTILLSTVTAIDAVVAGIDTGAGISIVVGSVALGFAVGFVRQRHYLVWYGIALLLGVVPFFGHLVLILSSSAGAGVPLCFVRISEPELGCSVALLPSLIFMTGVGAASKLITEEIAFRRLLIGISPGAGFASVLFSSTIAVAWYLVLARAGVGNAGLVTMGGIGALSAGSIYALSKSLLASAIFSATYAAGNASLTLAGLTAVPHARLIIAALVGVSLSVVVLRTYGFLGNLKVTAPADVTST